MRVLVLVLVVSILCSGVAFASEPAPEELLFLADTGAKGDGITTLFSVSIGLREQRAYLTPMPDAGYGPGAIPFDTVLALAVSKDNKRLYAIDNKTAGRRARLGYYDLESNTWTEVGFLSRAGQVRGIVQLAALPNGKLLMGAGSTDSLYVVNPTNARTTLIGKVINVTTGATVDIMGGDLVVVQHKSRTRFCLWANNARVGARRGLYRVTHFADDAVYVKWWGLDKQLPDMVTGMAVRFAGTGKMVASTTSQDTIYVLPRGPQVRGARHLPMYLNGERYTLYAAGDMSSNQ